jgi:outer membrane cobalamin receptor
MSLRARRRPVKVRCVAALVAGSWWASGGGAAAQQPPALQETVVVTGSATPVAFGNLTRTVRVISREEIARLPARSVADLLRLLANVDVRARGPRGVQTDFTLRGAGFGQALVLVDGLRLNNAQSGHHNGDIPVLVEDIERIEVLAGPGSALFGADAFGGTINVITRRGRGRLAPRSSRARTGSSTAPRRAGSNAGASGRA